MYFVLCEWYYRHYDKHINSVCMDGSWYIFIVMVFKHIFKPNIKTPLCHINYRTSLKILNCITVWYLNNGKLWFDSKCLMKSTNQNISYGLPAISSEIWFWKIGFQLILIWTWKHSLWYSVNYICTTRSWLSVLLFVEHAKTPSSTCAFKCFERGLTVCRVE